jgi:hypothetical protein
MTENLRNLWVSQQSSQVDHDLVARGSLSYTKCSPFATSAARPMRDLCEWAVRCSPDSAHDPDETPVGAA